MAPKIPGRSALGMLNVCLRPAIKPQAGSLLPVMQTAGIRMSEKEKKQFAKREPYKWAQMQQRMKADVKRHEADEAKRKETWGSPIHGIPTPYLESFDSVGQKEGISQYGDGNEPIPTSKHVLDHFLTRPELDAALQHAFDMTKPIDKGAVEGRPGDEYQELLKTHQSLHEYRSNVVRRILSMEMAAGKMRRHTNIKRIVDDFGRHNTDKVLKPKPQSITPNTVPMPGRSGPDTGSSEVQIAILTMKIRKLSQKLDGPKGNKDKASKRALTLLCHRRLRLLKYMERQERGSERWTNLLEKLGISPATWKEQIILRNGVR